MRPCVALLIQQPAFFLQQEAARAPNLGEGIRSKQIISQKTKQKKNKCEERR